MGKWKDLRYSSKFVNPFSGFHRQIFFFKLPSYDVVSPLFLKSLSPVSRVQQKALCAHRLNIRLLGVPGGLDVHAINCPFGCVLLEH